MIKVPAQHQTDPDKLPGQVRNDITLADYIKRAESVENPNIPATATHIWWPCDGFYSPWVTRLHYYRQDEDNVWWVYSEITGWRKTSNGPDWFEEETRLGNFKEIK